MLEHARATFDQCCFESPFSISFESGNSQVLGDIQPRTIVEIFMRQLNARFKQTTNIE